VRRTKAAIVGALVLLGCAPAARAQKGSPVADPVEHVFAIRDGDSLEAYVFEPGAARKGKPRAAVVVFYGGGWVLGEPSWAFGRARHFADRGMVAVAPRYRLSDRQGVSPLEAMADARAAFRWVRSNAHALGIDPGRIAAYGWSAGAHLAASAAIFGDSASRDSISSAPNALVFVSPALDLESDGWAQELLGKRASAASVSPAAHVRKGLPPTIIFQGESDTVTPLAGARLFCERMRAAGNRCELHVYPGVGHLFTPVGVRDDGWPQPDLTVQADAMGKADAFLKSLGFIR
jgi:acetyl esterase/lipase